MSKVKYFLNNSGSLCIITAEEVSEYFDGINITTGNYFRLHRGFYEDAVNNSGYTPCDKDGVPLGKTLREIELEGTLNSYKVSAAMIEAELVRLRKERGV